MTISCRSELTSSCYFLNMCSIPTRRRPPPSSIARFPTHWPKHIKGPAGSNVRKQPVKYLQPDLGRSVFSKQRVIANISAQGADISMPSLLHDQSFCNTRLCRSGHKLSIAARRWFIRNFRESRIGDGTLYYCCLSFSLDPSKVYVSTPDACFTSVCWPPIGNHHDHGNPYHHHRFDHCANRTLP